MRRERERSGSRDNLWLRAMRISSCYDNKQPITTNLSVNTSQSEYTYKVPPIRRQGQIPTLFQICWCSKINQLSQATRGFLTFLSSLLFLPLRGSSLRKPLAPRVHKQILTYLNNSIPNVLVSVWHLFVDMDAWTVEEDDILLSSNKKAIMELKKKRGGAEVMERIHFLEEIK